MIIMLHTGHGWYKHQVLAEWAESLSPMFMLMPDCQHIPSGHNSNISISIRMQGFDILMLIKCLICLVVPTSALSEDQAFLMIKEYDQGRSWEKSMGIFKRMKDSLYILRLMT